MKEQNSFQDSFQEESINLREQLESYLKYWPWFLFSVLIALIFATLYLRYTQNQYKAVATILVKDDRKGTYQSEMSAFEELGIMNVKNSVDNEIEIIKSRSVLQAAIKSLNFNVSYFTEGRVKTIELYENNPIEANFFETKDEFYKSSKNFIIKYKTESTFELKENENKSLGVFKYGAIIDLNDSKMVVTRRKIEMPFEEKNFAIFLKVSNLDQVTQSYKNRVAINQLSKNSSVVELTLIDPVPQKAADLLDAIIDVYNKDAIEDKNYISEKTQKFIDERLKYINEELGDVEKEGEVFLKKNKLTSISTEAENFVQNSGDFEKEIINTETQLKIVTSMIDYLKNSPKDSVIPNNIIPSSGENSINTGDLINQYNGFIIQRNRGLNNGATSKNSTIINLNNRIAEMRASINESLYRLLSSLRIKRNDLKQYERELNTKISEIPRQGREFKVIDRQQKIKETLYLYLLQKREEVGITLAVTAPNAKIIDSAMASKSPVSPNVRLVHIFSILLGLFIPFIIIFIYDFLDTKIKTKRDIDKVVSIPFLGDIPSSDSNDKIIEVNSRSSSAEAIRMIRTNLDFVLGNIPDDRCKTIFVTSSIPKEGKTFVSINLASTIALSSKKVLIIGLDIRNPKLNDYMNLPSVGLTNYLAKNDQNIHDYIVKAENFENLYVLPSGVIPPNPVELLSTNKINLLFDLLKKEFDYIIVDTPPVSLVTDTLIVAKNADAFIYVIRANYLDKRMLKFIEELYQSKKLPNLSILLNDTDLKKSYGYGGYGYGYGGYGYGYGYGIEHEKKSLYNRFFKKK